MDIDKTTDSCNTHDEVLLSMQRQQQEQLLHQQTNQLDTHSTGPGGAVGSTFTNMDHGFSSSTTVVGSAVGCAGDNGRTQSFTLPVYSTTGELVASAYGFAYRRSVIRSSDDDVMLMQDTKRRRISTVEPAHQLTSFFARDLESSTQL